MPPRDTAQEDGSVQEHHDESTKSAHDSTPKDSIKERSSDSKCLLSLRGSFHWKLNLYSSIVLALLYFLIPYRYRYVMQGVVALILIDAARYYVARGRKPGVPYTLPFVSTIAMVLDPVPFWAEMGIVAMNSGQGICTNTLAGNFMVFVTDPKLCRDIMTNEDRFGLYAHPNALWLFGRNNLIYLTGDIHKSFRAVLTPALFSNEALALYGDAQERVIRAFLAEIAAQCKQSDNIPIDARVVFRSMAVATSQESFLGPYLTDDLRQQLKSDIMTFTMGFLSFPFPYFGSGLHRAIQAKHRIEESVRTLIPQARRRVQNGHPPQCLLEHWLLAILNTSKHENVDVKDVPGGKDEDMAVTVLDFLFAAQDATNSILTYCLDVLDSHRDVWDKVRQEVWAECSSDVNACTVARKVRQADRLPYTRKVVNQLFHHKPPVPMVPHLTRTQAEIGPYSVAKGTIVIPSVTYSARASGASLDFLPERDDPDSMFVKTVVFGAGKHKCPGRRYAENLLTVFLAILASDYVFYRVGRRPSADEIMYFPTVFPSESHFVIRVRSEST